MDEAIVLEKMVGHCQRNAFAKLPQPPTSQFAECGLRIAKSKRANFKPPFRNPQFAYPQFCL